MTSHHNLTFFESLLTGHEEETWHEEIANGFTHLLGIIGSLLGIYILFVVAFFHRKSKEHIIGCAVYGACLLILYLFSTLYHSVGVFYHKDVLFKQEFRKLDHIAIYFMIAGSYTPMLLIGVIKKKTNLRIGYFVLICAIFGACMKFFVGPETIPDYISNGYYLFMGWLGVLAFKPIFLSLHPIVVRWQIISGIAYSTGVWFLTWDRLHFNHAIWHLHVMAGSFAGYIAIILIAILLPSTPVTKDRNALQIIYHFLYVIVNNLPEKSEEFTVPSTVLHKNEPSSGLRNRKIVQ